MSQRVRRWRHWYLAGLVATVGLVWSVASCGSDDEARLDLLREEPLTTVRLDGVVDERLTESPGNSGLGLSAPATYRRTFVLGDAGTAGAIDALAVAAESSGWTLSPRELLGFSGRKKIDGVDAQLVISGNDAERTVWFEIAARG